MKIMKMLRYATMLVFLLASIRVITGASELTSTGTASAALLLSVPIVLAALGGLFSERAGVVNIGLEGMMIMGAWAGGVIGSQHGPWAGLIAAVIFGSTGLVGSGIKEALSASSAFTQILSPTHGEIDLMNIESVTTYLSKTQPDVVIMAAGQVGGILFNSAAQQEQFNSNFFIEIL